MLDEECLRPGVVNDTTFLAKLNHLFSKHTHYESKVTQNAQRQYDRTMGLSSFRICHYAGKVTWQGWRVETRAGCGWKAMGEKLRGDEIWEYFMLRLGAPSAGTRSWALQTNSRSSTGDLQRERLH